MKDLRILFMGTPQFATTILEAILGAGYNVVGVVTAADKPAGRGRKIQQSDVKQFAEKHNLKVLQPTNLKSDEFQEDLQQLQPNLCVVVAFRMLPEKVWRFPKYGTFNLHASLLPQYRGAAPIHWAIINGEETTGVSTFFIDEKIDTGAMILQKELAISQEDTVGILHNKLMTLGAEAVLETLNLIAQNKVTTRPQSSTKGLKTANKLTNENTRIDWSQGLKVVYNKIRGLNPFPAAWTILHHNDEELRMKLYAVNAEKVAHDLSHGHITVEDENLKIAVEGGFIIVQELQLPNKRKMTTKDLLNGFSMAEDSYVS